MASLDVPEVAQAERYVLSHPKLAKGTSVPFCVFAIGVRGPEGRYRWVAEPVIEEGRAYLDTHPRPQWVDLNEEAAAALVRRVSEWYDALQATLTPNTPSGRPGNG